MDANDPERVTNAMDQKHPLFKKDKLKNVMADFEVEGYSAEFLKDLKSGLEKSSIYTEYTDGTENKPSLK